jgi:hypothetical protein
MANFPFVVQPRLKPIVEKIGSEEAGYIECKRQGYLTVGEKAGVRQIVGAYDATNDVIGLSRKVSELFKIDLQEAYQLVSDCVTNRGEDPRSAKISAKYEDELSALLSKMTQAAVFSELAKAFVLILYRVEGSSGVTMDSVSELHPDLLTGLAALYDEEEAKTVEKLLEDNNGKDINQVEEAGKK